MLSLEIFIVTYNRSAYLSKTLNYLSNSVFKDYNITVLNNCSTDDTEAVVNNAKGSFKNLKISTHKNNIGACANIMRAFELSTAAYTWVLCDDDDFDFSDAHDILDIINKGEVNLIHTGAHADIGWQHGGATLSPAQLLQKGYHYFKASSFIPCNIFKTERFQKDFLIAGFDNIANGYPHMPYLFDIYKQNEKVYLSKKQLVTANTGQFYSLHRWFFWWMSTCKKFKNKEDVRLVFFDHFDEKLVALYDLIIDYASKDEYQRDIVMDFVKLYFTEDERKGLSKEIKKRNLAKKEKAIKDRIKKIIRYS